MAESHQSRLRRFHQRVAAQADALVQGAPLAGQLNCGLGCTDCCIDDLNVFAIEADRIRQDYPEVLRQQASPVGRCAFLNQAGACRIYSARPYVCRTQGLPLAWQEALDPDPLADLTALETIERRDICPLNDTPQLNLAALPTSACWPIGPAEEELQQLEIERFTQLNPHHDSGQAPFLRVRLRSLFGGRA